MYTVYYYIFYISYVEQEKKNINRCIYGTTNILL